MSPYVCDCTNVVYMFCVYCIYYYVNKFEARSSFSTSHLLNSSNIVGRIGNIFLNHLCDADNLCLISLSSVGMQKFLGICSKYAIDHSYTMTKKLFSLCFIPGTLKFGRLALYIMDDLQIPNVSECKYLGTIRCQKNCDLDIKRQMRKFYANAN